MTGFGTKLHAWQGKIVNLFAVHANEQIKLVKENLPRKSCMLVTSA
jgi:hypothetical protein